MINWVKGTWEKGDSASFHQGPGHKEERLDVFPGLYWYSGFGSGDLFKADGTMTLNCTPQEAAAEAKRLNLPFQYVDSFHVSTFTSVMG